MKEFEPTKAKPSFYRLAKDKDRPFNWREMYTGDLELFDKVLQNPETVFVYDIDGILANSPKVVLPRFTAKTGIRTNPAEINEFGYLTGLAKKAGLPDEIADNVEADWYNPEILALAQKYLYMTPVVDKTLSYYGPERNFSLTSRNPKFKESTPEWFSRKYPKFKKENILMRDDDTIDSLFFKVENLARLSKAAPWVVYLDDDTRYAKAAIDADIPNCLVINIPLGRIVPDFRHERLIVIKRYPEYLQAMYPLLFLVDRAIGNRYNK